MCCKVLNVPLDTPNLPTAYLKMSILYVCLLIFKCVCDVTRWTASMWISDFFLSFFAKRLRHCNNNIFHQIIIKFGLDFDFPQFHHQKSDLAKPQMQIAKSVRVLLNPNLSSSSYIPHGWVNGIYIWIAVKENRFKSISSITITTKNLSAKTKAKKDWVLCRAPSKEMQMSQYRLFFHLMIWQLTSVDICIMITERNMSYAYFHSCCWCSLDIPFGCQTIADFWLIKEFIFRVSHLKAQSTWNPRC